VAAAAWFRILKPGGKFLAQVGIDDHLAMYQGKVGSKRYLRYSHRTWDWLLGNEVQYINRLTATEIVNILTEAGGTRLRPDPRSRRYAPGLAARAGQLQKRYLIHAAGYKPGIANAIADRGGTPREFIAIASGRLLAILQLDGVLIVTIFVVADNQRAAFVVMIRPIPLG
jgi:hypothetical protein